MNWIIIPYLFLFFHFYFICISACPEKCICKITSVKCKRLFLTGVPKNISLETTHLDLSFNSIKNLTANSFEHLTNLKFLRLDHNNMKTIDENAFVGLKNLRDLYIVENDLSNLHPETFNKGLHKLLHVYLGNNEFETIPKLKVTQMVRLNLDSNRINNAHIDESFLENTALQTLVLTKNFIKTISKTDLVNLKNTQLINLMLKMNSLESIDPDAFVPVRGTLKTLELEGNKLLNSSVIERALAGFTDGSGSMLFLDLKSCGLTTISASFFLPFSKSKLHHLDVSANPQLSQVAPTAFQSLSRLQILHLDHCHLASADIAFSALARLRELHLHSNNLLEIPSRLPGSLETLTLDANQIQAVRDHHFKSLSALATLQLSRNAISSIEAGSFRDLSSLVTLDLSHNRLSRLDDGVFVGMAALETLTLVKQNPCLKELTPGGLVLTRLQELVLDENCLGDAARPLGGAFQHLAALRNLSVADNRLTRLDDRFLEGLAQLEKLDLSRNELVAWGPRTFLPVVAKLATLDLSMNRIATVARDCLESSCDNYMPDVISANSRLQSWRALVSVAMDNNAWNCESCSHVEWLVRHQNFLVKSDKMLCQHPSVLQGLPVLVERANCSSQITPTQLPTSDDSSHRSLPHVLSSSGVGRTVIKAVSGVIVVMVLVPLLFYFVYNRKRIFSRLHRFASHKNGYRRFPTDSSSINVVTNEICPSHPQDGEDAYENFEGSRLALTFMEADPVDSTPEVRDTGASTPGDDDLARGDDADDCDFVFVSDTPHAELDQLEEKQGIRVKQLTGLVTSGDRRLARHCPRLVVEYPPPQSHVVLREVLVSRARSADKPTYLFQHANNEIDWDTFPLAELFRDSCVPYNNATLVNRLINYF